MTASSIELSISAHCERIITMESKKISVVVCCYSMDRLDDIREAINSIVTQTLKSHEVIVAVDHNVDLFHTLKVELPLSVKVVLNEGVRGLSETRNVGISTSSGEIVAFIDDDAVADKLWLEKLSRCYSDSSVVAAGGRAVPQWSDRQRPSWFPEELDWVIGCHHKGPLQKSNEVRNMIGCNMSFRREAFEKAGLFSNRLGRVGKLQGLGEETEICMRMKHTMPNSVILYEPDAIIYHKVPYWRVTWKYLVQRSHNEGLYKIIVRNLALGTSTDPLSSENSYLRYLLLVAIPGRIRGVYKKCNFSQLLAITLSIAAVGIGYIEGITRTTRLLNGIGQCGKSSSVNEVTE